MQVNNGRLILEDNKGGDVLEINCWGKNKFEFKVGHHCVWTIQKEGTISEITAYLTKLVEGAN